MQSRAPLLLSLGLIAPRPPILMKSSDGVFLEVYKWKPKAAKAKAHKTPDVLSLWNLMLELGKNVELSTVPETR